MARAARDPRRQAALLGLLAVLGIACAVVQEPPGGPPDFTPPVIVAITPDSGAVAEELDRPLRIQFDEVISEQSGGGLANLVQLSPRAEELNVSWKRKAMTIEPKGGWRRGLVYHVVLLPGIADLRNNRTTEGRTVILSTGGPIPDTRLAGTVLDWENGQVARNAVVEAVLLPDSLVYFTQSDSIGDFALGSIPRGTYLVIAAVDGNNNRQREPREPFDSVTVGLDSVGAHLFWTFTHDTLGPQIQQAARVDSVTFRVEFNQKLTPGAPDSEAVQVWALPDTTPVAVAAIWQQATWDSVAAAQAAAADTGAAADTAGVGADTAAVGAREQRRAAGADTLRAAAAGGRVRQRAAAEAAQQDTAAVQADTSRIANLLAERPRLSATWYVRLLQPLVAGARYLIEGRARNLSGATAESRTVLTMPAPQDST